jgi:hypothetical protein
MMPGIEELEAFRVCRRACLDAVRRALDAEGPELDDAQLGLLLDGAEVCETTIRFRRRNSPLHPRVCAACVDICERCAGLCETLADDSVMRACGDACRRCAAICRQLVGDPHTGGAPLLGPGRTPWSDEADDGPAQARSRRARA